MDFISGFIVQPQTKHLADICRKFLSIQYWNNSEYWSQKHTQSGNIYSTELDVYAVKQSEQNLSFIYSQHRQGRKYYALASSSLTTRHN